VGGNAANGDNSCRHRSEARVAGRYFVTKRYASTLGVNSGARRQSILECQSPRDAIMRKRISAVLLTGLLGLSIVTLVDANPRDPMTNPAIDMDGYLRVSREAAQHRATRRVTEEEFIRMSREPNTIVLDARSRQKYDELHVKGAVNLAFSDIAIESLARTIPDKNTRILIYCNNNFANAPQPFPAKRADASLNISTYIALYNYGYRNVYELGPLIALEKSKLPFESGVAKNAAR
jgi:phage shock protein E